MLKLHPLFSIRSTAIGLFFYALSAPTFNPAQAAFISPPQSERVMPAERHVRVMPAGLTDDPLAVNQWYLQSSPEETAGTGLADAWELPRLLDHVVVAVVDTGILASHSDMGNVLPGYDFVRDVNVANDGDGMDSDPTDPGDWVAQPDIDTGALGSDCATSSSSWHGTAVSGILAANSNNALGISGAAPHIDILPVRVMGRCGGTVSDLIDGIRWAAGLEVEGAPLNKNPAAVINLSLGYVGICYTSMQAAISDARRAGSLVVTAIGNGGQSLADQPYSPASCNGVLTVASSDRSGNYAYYNNFGAAVDILAPGGVPGAGLTTLDDGGRQSAKNDDRFTPRYGSSLATPLVSAAAALMIASNPLLEPVHVEALLLQNTRELSDKEGCPDGSCSATLLDAHSAVRAAANADLQNLALLADEEYAGGGGSAHPLWLLLLLCHQGFVAKIAQLVQHRGGKLPRR